MRGNHRVWGREYPPDPDATNAEQRQRIAKVELREKTGYKHRRECWFDGRKIGDVKWNMSSQQYRPVRCKKWRFAGHRWTVNDPPFCLAILGLMDELVIK